MRLGFDKIRTSTRKQATPGRCRQGLLFQSSTCFVEDCLKQNVSSGLSATLWATLKLCKELTPPSPEQVDVRVGLGKQSVSFAVAEIIPRRWIGKRSRQTVGKDFELVSRKTQTVLEKAKSVGQVLPPQWLCLTVMYFLVLTCVAPFT